MNALRRFAPTAPAEWPWNRWPNAAGITGRMALESVAESRGMRTLAEQQARELAGSRAQERLAAEVRRLEAELQRATTAPPRRSRKRTGGDRP